MIPAFLNPDAGNAEAAGELLAADRRFALQALPPKRLMPALQTHVERGARRILVAGGDGTVATAARALLFRSVELAVLPAGTHNHFAKTLGIPADLEQALEIAASGGVRSVEVGMVNDEHLFLNTSSVGAYVDLVRRRERLQSHLGRSAAAALSAGALALRLPRVSLELEVRGRAQRYQTPLLFVGVGERDMNSPNFGERVGAGAAALHTVVVRGKGRARLFAIGLAAAAQGIWRAARSPHLDSYLVEHCRVDMPKPMAQVALDGEIVALRPPIQYRIAPDAITVVAPPREIVSKLNLPASVQV